MPAKQKIKLKMYADWHNLPIFLTFSFLVHFLVILRRITAFSVSMIYIAGKKMGSN